MSKAVSATAEMPVTASAQEAAFVQRVIERRFVRLEVASRPAVAHMAASGLLAFGAITLAQRGFAGASIWLPAVGAVALLGLAVGSLHAERARGRADSTDALSGCYDRGGELVPVLAPGETLLHTCALKGPDARALRRSAATALSLMGFLLSGLPLAALEGASESPSIWLSAWAAFFSLLGALLFGRGVHLLLSAGPAQWLALTDQRLVAMLRPGAARSLKLASLEHKPVVVRRKLGGATVAFQLARQPSTGMLPVLGLWGLDDISPELAQQWAADVTRIRGLRGEVSNVP